MEIISLFLLVLIALEATYLTVMKIRQRTLKVSRGALLLDTSAIMDGRIVEVAKTGIITAEMIIPRSVLNEMQLLADKADSEKRARARQGLENVRTLEKIDEIAVTIVQDGHVGSGGVDERLLDLAQKYGANIATVDYNLNKVAKTLGIVIVNVNELAQSLRFQHLPGEKISLNLIQEGAQREQAVGYLDDGTMIVVEDAKNLIGQTIEVEITRSLQTEAGRMMFAKKIEKSYTRDTKNSKALKNLTKSSANSAAKLFNTKKPSTIKSSPAFHSDQITGANFLNKITKKSAETPVTKPDKKTSAKKSVRRKSRETSKTAEDAMVALANKK